MEDNVKQFINNGGTTQAPYANPLNAIKVAPIVKTDPILNTKRQVPLKDVYGGKTTLEKGEALTPHILADGKVLVKDGDEHVINKNQYENLKGNSEIQKEGKEFAPELNQVNEIRKGGYEPDQSDIATYMADEAGQGLTREEARANLIDQNTDNFPATKFSQYVLPGGSNYRETLLQAPSKYDEIIKQMREVGAKKPFSVEDAQRYTELNNQRNSEVNNSYKSPHWDEPNVLTHLRMDDRMTPDNKKVLFLEELQSDWANSLRKNGGQSLSIEPATNQPGNQFWVNNANDSNDNGMLFENRQEAEDYVRKNSNPTNPMVKNWQDIALKRALKEAVDGNYDYMAWTNGKQQAERYDLAKYVDNINWMTHPQNPNNRIISIHPRNGYSMNITVNKDGTVLNDDPQYAGKKLEDVIGKDASGKIMKDSLGTLEPKDLAIGGEWAHNLYDKVVPNKLQDLTGQKAENLRMDIQHPRSDSSGDWFIRPQNGRPAATLTEKNMETGKIVQFPTEDDPDGNMDWEITGVDPKKGEFDAIPYKNMNGWRANMQAGIRSERPSALQKTFSLHPAVDQYQQGIKITPAIKALVQGKQVKLKQPSGKMPTKYFNPANIQYARQLMGGGA